MAPKRTVGATKAAAPAAKKAKTAAPEAPLLDFIGKCDEIPKACRELLQTAVPICLEVTEADRHKFQTEVLGRLASLLGSTQSKKEATIASHEGELAEIEKEKATAGVEVSAKKAVSDAKKKECDAKGEVADAARQASNEANGVLKEKKKAEDAFNKKKADLHAERDNFAKLLAEIFAPLKDGTLTGHSSKKTKGVADMRKKLIELGAQASLGDAIAQTLKMTPEKRAGTFAQTSMKFAEDYFTNHTAKVAKDIAGLDAEAATHATAVANAEAILADKKGALEVVEKDWDSMQDIWVALEKEAATAARALQQIEAKMPKVIKSIDKAKADLEKFSELTALYAKLKEHSTAVAEEPEEEAAEEEKADEDMGAGDEKAE